VSGKESFAAYGEGPWHGAANSAEIRGKFTRLVPGREAGYRSERGKRAVVFFWVLFGGDGHAEMTGIKNWLDAVATKALLVYFEVATLRYWLANPPMHRLVAT